MATAPDAEAEKAIGEAERHAVLEEYKALRAEILALIQARNQFMLSDILAFGALFAAAVQFNNVFFLVAPLIHFPFMFYWAYLDRHIISIGHYIKDTIEPRISGLRWERTMFASRLGVWEEVPLPTFGPLWIWKPKRFSSIELSGLATFAGSTVLSLVSYASGISVGNTTPPPPAVNGLTTTFLVILNFILLVHSYRIVRQSHSDFRRYLRRAYWYSPDREKPADYPRLLTTYQRRFHCSMPGCNNRSSGPAEEPLDTQLGDALRIVQVHWNTPTELKRCSDCGHWFCDLHYKNQLSLCGLCSLGGYKRMPS